MPLDEQLLDRLDAQWARLRPQWHATLAPGLSEEEQNELVAPLGLTIPPELRMWWAWRTTHTVPVTPSSAVFSLPDAVDNAHMHREVADDVAGEPGSTEAQFLWPHEFLSVVSWSPRQITVDCTVQEPASPLFVYDAWEDPEKYRDLFMPSFGALIHIWVEMYEADRYAWDEGKQAWIGQGPAAGRIAQVNLI